MNRADGRRVAIVTGASGGIGAGLVNSFRGAGFAVVATSRSIRPGGDGDVLAVAGDIAAADTARRVMTAATDRFGRIDTLVNNAGVFIGKPFTEYTQDDLTATVAVNLAGFFHMTQLVLARMVEQGGGHVVSITTSLVDHADGTRPSTLASLTKGGIAAATRSLRWSTRRTGVRVNAVAPGGSPRRSTTARRTRDGRPASPRPRRRGRRRRRGRALPRAGRLRHRRDAARSSAAASPGTERPCRTNPRQIGGRASPGSAVGVAGMARLVHEACEVPGRRAGRWRARSG